MKNIAFEIQLFASILNEDTNNKIVVGTSEADIISNTVSDAIINSAEGDDVIANGKMGVTPSRVTINGAEGNDSINNRGSYSFIMGAEGNDTISYMADNDGTLDGGSGNDKFLLDSAKNLSVNGGDGDDYISFSRANVNTVKGGQGNDTINLGYDYRLKYASPTDGIVYQYEEGDGDDLIVGLSSWDILKIAGDVSSIRTADGFLINVGNNTITVKDYVIVTSRMSRQSVTGSEYGDLFIGAGNSHFVIDALDGNDTISNGDDTQSSGNGLSISGGGGDDNIYVYSGSNHTLVGGEGNDTITHLNPWFNYEGVVSNIIDGGTGDDSITASGSYSTIIAGTGNDVISNKGNDVTILCGDGNDSICNYYGDSVLISGGDGDDVIFLRSNTYNTTGKGSMVTVNSGKGNDTIQNTAEDEWGRAVKNIFQYSKGDGNDVIVNFNHSDELHVAGNFATIENGNDIVIQVGEGSVVLKDLKGENIFSRNHNGINIISLGTDTTTLPADYNGFSSIPSENIDYSTGNSSDTPSNDTNSLPNIQIVAKEESSTPTVINNYYGNYIDMSGNNGTIIVDSTINGDVSNSTIIDNSTQIINNVNNFYIYNGGNKVINNYQQGEVVQLASDYQGIDLNGNSFYVNSSSGQLEIQNSRDKFIGYSGSDNNVVAYSYLASGGGQIDGSGKSQAEIMIGADNADNQIYAGNAGSSLWGGNGGADTLTGGDGYDEFFFAMGSGNDVVQNAGDNDVINLLGVSLSQISGFNYDSSSVDLNFNDGGHLKVESTSSVGYRVENQTFYFNRSTNEWANK